ncbi:divalent cation tolerance protein CutA [Desulfosarcina sp.]|uniref:divalent cation tolerance protein CutA n=1 Tax=Desulfosarcina sp. TaxID=2027861 RepID=UPI0039B8C75A
MEFSIGRFESKKARSREWPDPLYLEELETLIYALQPYEIPEWVVVPMVNVLEKYLNWAISSST